ncbi:MAG: hypothetical protein WCO63_15715 [Bacteroidota bacterium]
MKNVFLILLVSLFSLTIIAQNMRDSINNLIIRYHSSFSPFSETYELKVITKSIAYVSPFKELPDSLEKRKSKNLSVKKWAALYELIEKTKFDSIGSSTGQGIDGAWYYINIEYCNGLKKYLEIRSGYAPESLYKIHEFLRKELKIKR